MRRSFVTIVLLLVPFAAPASAMKDAEHAMRAGDYAEAYCIMRPMAERGYAEAQYNIGWMYHNGYGLAVNDTLALEWWRRASEQGHIDASFSIATLYNHGAGEVARDRDKALDYFLTAAHAGHEDAVLILRSMIIRDDKSIRDRRKDIVAEYGHLFGELWQVKVPLANLRADASTEAAIVTQLEQGARVIVMDVKPRWKLVAIVGSGEVAWIYSTLLEAVEGEGGQAAGQADEATPGSS